jgi:FAD/FMN-containing dehydrogenase/Fe-S oxidoreductase
MATIAAETTTRQRPSADLDARDLAAELTRSVRGEVRFSPGSRALYANDASVYRQVPIGVVVPRTVDDVVATVAVCRRHGAPIVPRGCGTGLAGQTVNQAVLIDFSKYLHELIELDHGRRRARVQPGIVLDWLRNAAEEHELTFGPDPATHSRCTLGGMIGNNSCGTHSIIAGVTADNIESLDVLLYDGTRLRLPSRVSEDEIDVVVARGGREGDIYRRLRDLRDRYAELVRARYPQIPRRISGYNLDRLLPEGEFNLAAAFVGSEATLGLVLEAELKLIHSPQHRTLVVIGYEDCPTGADQNLRIMEFDPIGLETFDRQLLLNELGKGFKRHPELLPEGDGWVLVEFGGDSQDEADEKGRRLCDAIERGTVGPAKGFKLYDEPSQESQVWEIREGGVGHSRVPGGHPGWPSWEDAAVAPEDCGNYLRDLESLCAKHGRRISTYYGHIGHGCVHTRIDWDFLTPAGVANYRAFMEDAAELVCSKYNGSLSGEHGEGQARAELLDRMFGTELVHAFREFKAIWDPDGQMNPGKVIDPYPLDTNLRYHPGYRTRHVETTFRYPNDQGLFANAVDRCFGVGACRDQSGTMCPSYQATLEEKHSTRGRARLLFEMMRSDSLQGGWRDEEVKQALDLCLACKGCKHECPVQVDMATYKAEFFSHYFKRRLHPRTHYALGLIHWEARLASLAPRVANFLLQREPWSTSGRRLVGVSEHRKPPAFARRTIRAWFGKHESAAIPGAQRVLLWPDTFTNHFHPEVAIAATRVLEAAGCHVVIPERTLCCGRPLYDYGMLDLARRKLRQLLDELRPELEAGTPIIALEPSCGAVLRDEAVEMLSDDADAQRLKALTVSLAEFLTLHAQHWQPRRLERKALLHLHCHQKATADTDCDRNVLEQIGIEVTTPDSGCCGLAGSFGYEAGDKYDVSVKAAGRVLWPAVRHASEDTVVVSDGFSCRSQIEHGTERRALHLAQVLELAVPNGTTARPQDAAGPA